MPFPTEDDAQNYAVGSLAYNFTPIRLIPVIGSPYSPLKLELTVVSG